MNIYPRMKRPCLPLPAVQAATTKNIIHKVTKYCQPRMFCPPKITSYTILHQSNEWSHTHSTATLVCACANALHIPGRIIEIIGIQHDRCTYLGY